MGIPSHLFAFCSLACAHYPGLPGFTKAVGLCVWSRGGSIINKKSVRIGWSAFTDNHDFYLRHKQKIMLLCRVYVLCSTHEIKHDVPMNEKLKKQPVPEKQTFLIRQVWVGNFRFQRVPPCPVLGEDEGERFRLWLCTNGYSRFTRRDEGNFTTLQRIEPNSGSTSIRTRAKVAINVLQEICRDSSQESFFGERNVQVYSLWNQVSIILSRVNQVFSDVSSFLCGSESRKPYNRVALSEWCIRLLVTKSFS